MPRKFDMLLFEGTPGLYFPNFFDDVDHIINLARVSTHVMSHFTTALKNWVGYLLNDRAAGSHPLRSESPYHELLPELHLPTVARERLVFADASGVIVSGGPDESPDPYYPAGLMLAATDLVTADVLNLAALRLGVLASKLEQGLGGKCEDQPDTMVEALFDFVKWRLEMKQHDLMRGTDLKLCDPTFSNWDWVVLQRARELGLGAQLPSDVGLSFAHDGAHAVPPAQEQWLTADALRSPVY
jgi:hypothetical protein